MSRAGHCGEEGGHCETHLSQPAYSASCSPRQSHRKCQAFKEIKRTAQKSAVVSVDTMPASPLLPPQGQVPRGLLQALPGAAMACRREQCQMVRDQILPSRGARSAEGVECGRGNGSHLKRSSCFLTWRNQQVLSAPPAPAWGRDRAAPPGWLHAVPAHPLPVPAHQLSLLMVTCFGLPCSYTSACCPFPPHQNSPSTFHAPLSTCSAQVRGVWAPHEVLWL